MTTTPKGQQDAATQPNLEALRLDLPMIAATRVHQSRAVPAPASTTLTEDLWLADLDSPMRLSRWANPFRQVDLGAFEPGRMGRRKQSVLDACGLATGRVVMLANPDTHSTTPSAFWVLDEAGLCIARVVDVLPHLEGNGLLVADPATATLAGTITAGSTRERVSGRLHSHLGDDGVRLGIQLTSAADATPLLTVSMSGSLSAANPRTLLQAATALAA